MGDVYIRVHTEIRVPKLPANALEGRGNIEQNIGVRMPRTSGKLATVFFGKHSVILLGLLKKSLFRGPDFHFCGDQRELLAYLWLYAFLLMSEISRKQITGNPRLMIILMTHINSFASMLL